MGKRGDRWHNVRMGGFDLHFDRLQIILHRAWDLTFQRNVSILTSADTFRNALSEIIDHVNIEIIMALLGIWKELSLMT